MADFSSERFRLAKYRVTHLCTVEGVKSRFALKEEVKSSRFSCPEESHPVKFHMDIDFGTQEPDWLSIFLYSDKDVYVECASFEIMDAELEPLLPPRNMQKLTIQDQVIQRGDNMGTINVYDLTKFKSAGDTLCIKCDVSFNGASKSVDYATIPTRDPTIRDDFSKLFTQPLNAQVVTFTFGEKKLNAHKDILVARSSYFKTLFDSGMKEAQTNEIPIEEAEPEHFQELLTFIYSGFPPTNLPIIAQSLLPLADRYAIMTLRNMCITAIITTLNLKNVIRVMLLADAHSCPELTKKCLPLIKENIKTLKTTEDWKELKKNPEILAMVLESFGE